MAAPGNRIGKKEKNEDFYKAILLLKDEEECYSFFRDVCTIAELRAMEQRFEVARMLTQGKVYSEILERTGASSATISRVARSLTDSDGGYERIFARMKGEKESYSALAASYDELTKDVGYEKRAAFVEKLFLRSHIPVHTVLDLACGTGTMTALLTERGYELIGVDGSEDMLLEAREKAQTLTGVPPLFLHQSMPELDLYGTVEAAICCLDSLNYLTEAREVRETFRRLHLFIAPGGSLVFDVHALGKLEAMDGQVWLDEREDVYCVWRTEYSRRSRLLDYYVDIFSVRADGAWERSFEEHRQRWYSVSELTEWLTAAGFGEIRVYGDCRLRAPNETDGRIYISCIRKE